jgi:hypothetical protein
MKGGLTSNETQLLTWLGEEEFSQYGECHSKAFDVLVAKGLAQVHEKGEHQGSFIAKGTTNMHAAVSLTEAGRSLLRLVKKSAKQ